MDKKTQLLQDLDTARELMRTVVDSLDPKDEVYPGWKIKQVMAHITGWDEASIDSIKAFAGGGESAITAYKGINEYNADSVETRQDLSEEQTRREWEVARIELKAALLNIPNARFDEEILFPWGYRASLETLVTVLIEHERDHANEIRDQRLAGSADKPA